MDQLAGLDHPVQGPTIERLIDSLSRQVRDMRAALHRDALISFRLLFDMIERISEFNRHVCHDVS